MIERAFVMHRPVATASECAPMSKHMARTSSDTPHAVCDASPTSMEDVTPALGVTDTPSPVIEHVVPASAVACAVPAPMTEFVAPIPVVMAPALGVTLHGPAPVRDLRFGDIVYIRHRERPYNVFRIGHGYLVSMVRVALLTEDTSIWEVGEWVCSERCYRL